MTLYALKKLYMSEIKEMNRYFSKIQDWNVEYGCTLRAIATALLYLSCWNLDARLFCRKCQLIIYAVRPVVLKSNFDFINSFCKAGLELSRNEHRLVEDELLLLLDIPTT